MSSSALCALLVNATNSDLATNGYRQTYLALFIIFLILTLAGIFIFQLRRIKSGRLAKRSLTLIVVSSFAVILSSVVVLFREYYGRQNFPCRAVLIMHELTAPLIAGPLIAKVYVHAFRLKRSQVRAGLSFAAVRKEQDRIDQKKPKEGQRFLTKISSFLFLKPKNQSISNHNNTTTINSTNPSELEDHFEVVSPHSSGHLDEEADPPLSASSPSSSPFRPASKRSLVEFDINLASASIPQQRKKSLVEGVKKKTSRQASYHNDARASSSFWWGGGNPNFKTKGSETKIALDELIKNESTWLGILMVIILAIPFIISICIRSTTDPKYIFNCDGCNFELIDVYVNWGLSIVLLGLFVFSVLLLWRTPDPLGILWEAKLCCFILIIFGSPIYLLYIFDPFHLEAEYRFTWFTFETITYLLIFMVQTFGQVYLTERTNIRLKSKNISLFRLLENVELRDMFDDHLTGEFSIENLRFWDRALHWKSFYFDLPKDEVQRRANDLYRIFISKDAAMPLNLSSANENILQTIFVKAQENPDFLVPINVFDNALKECFKLMHDGLSRFLVSDRYLQFRKLAPPDFEGDFLRNKELGLDLDVSLEEYLKQFEKPRAANSLPNNINGNNSNFESPPTPNRGKSLVEGFSLNRSDSLLTSKLILDDTEDDQRPLSMRMRGSLVETGPVEGRKVGSIVQLFTPKRSSLIESETTGL